MEELGEWRIETEFKQFVLKHYCSDIQNLNIFPGDVSKYTVHHALPEIYACTRCGDSPPDEIMDAALLCGALEKD